MSRIATCFSGLAETGRCALIPFVTAGDPEPSVTVDLMHAMVAAGADIVELGVPFSDPMADGPVIQRASERALAHNVALHDVLDMVKRFRQSDDHTPVVLMGYLNPVEAMGYESFASNAANAGVDGVLTVDLPPGEGAELVSALKSRQIDTIFLVAPTSNAERIARINAMASGFIYYVSLKGVTGASNLDIDGVSAKLKEIRTISKLPLGVGFGVKEPADAAKLASLADAVIVGSTLVKIVEANAAEPAKIPNMIGETLAAFRKAMDAVS
ncbi:MAG: tryptophan synthase subunit alpha [Gammaproteobacteria bacterium]|nr:MAG: tryptophan synthase subunit alpha [Gammaproteobacteria bacterium]